MTVRYITRAELDHTILDALTQYPFLASWPVDCHTSCAAWDIDTQYGRQAREAWEELNTALWMAGMDEAGIRTETP